MLAAVWGALIVGWLWLAVVWWILLALVLFTLPALWDMIVNRQSSLTLDDAGLAWQSPMGQHRIAYADIDRMRFDTRLDFSVRVTVVRQDGRKLRLPYDCLPPHKMFEDALRAQGVTVERHHFSLL